MSIPPKLGAERAAHYRHRRAVSELLEAFRTGEGVDLIRESVRLVMQELIEVEAAERIGAARYHRTEPRVAERNGTRPGCWPLRPATWS